ncbi:MAG: L-ribulose-5-phosphate 4-epimerase [Eubacteriales bacterium]
MLLPSLREQVYRANMLLFEHKLITFTWGNVSGIDREQGIVLIKPSGVPYEDLSPENMVALDLDGNVLEGDLKPSSDTPTHLVLYRAFEGIGGVTHTHSRAATAWAQAGQGIPAIGTTHADTFAGDIPCTREMTRSEIEGEYEKETGNVIVERFQELDPLNIPAVLVHSHGPFTWGKDATASAENAVVLEEVANMAYMSTVINGSIPPQMSLPLLNKHFFRKHGSNAYYGQ